MSGNDKKDYLSQFSLPILRQATQIKNRRIIEETNKQTDRMNQGVIVNLPLASANHSNADADAPSYSSTPVSKSVSKMCVFLEISDLDSYIEDEMLTRLPSHKRCR
jgi:hypothetical protein